MDRWFCVRVCVLMTRWMDEHVSVCVYLYRWMENGWVNVSVCMYICIQEWMNGWVNMNGHVYVCVLVCLSICPGEWMDM